MQENGTEQPKVYRRTRSMLKIRCTPTEVEQTRYRNSQSTESEKAEFHTPAIPNMARNCVKENSLENISQDLVQMTVPTPDTYPQASAASFDSKSEEREEIADGDNRGTRYLHSRILKVNKKELWEASQFI